MSILSELKKRALELDLLADELGWKLTLKDCEFTRLRFEVVGRQALDAWTSYYRLLYR
jgi:hypothetical protein